MDNDKRDLEEEYFRKQDQELIEKMRKAAAAEESRRALGAQSGIGDPALLREIELLGFTPETVALLPLVPILQVAWAEGGVSPEERKMILEVARTRGIVAESAADRQLADWLAHKPPQDVFIRAGRLISAMLAAHSGEAGALTADDLVKHAESIAAASGGIFGMNKISKEERAAIAQIQAALRGR
jgi:tellurite resistance protein